VPLFVRPDSVGALLAAVEGGPYLVELDSVVARVAIEGAEVLLDTVGVLAAVEGAEVEADFVVAIAAEEDVTRIEQN
jgi:hypothetical protein